MENASIISVFTLSGLNQTMQYRGVLFFFTLLCYFLIVLLNVGLVLTILLDENLHEPMYMFLCNICISGFYGATGFYPKFLLDLLSDAHVISYAGCLFQALVIYSSVCSDFSTLAVMAYDRYVAICRPLEYHSVMTRQWVCFLMVYSGLSPYTCFSVLVGLTSRLQLCGSQIQKLYCDNWSVVKLACTSTITNNIVGYIVIVFFFGHVIFIAFSYVYLIKSCLKSIDSRGKFMQTCLPHLLSLLNVTAALFFDVLYTRYGSTNLPQSLQNFLALQFLIVPQILNPLIYGLKLSKVKKRIQSYCVKF